MMLFIIILLCICLSGGYARADTCDPTVVSMRATIVPLQMNRTFFATAPPKMFLELLDAAGAVVAPIGAPWSAVVEAYFDGTLANTESLTLTAGNGTSLALALGPAPAVGPYEILTRISCAAESVDLGSALDTFVLTSDLPVRIALRGPPPTAMSPFGIFPESMMIFDAFDAAGNTVDLPAEFDSLEIWTSAVRAAPLPVIVVNVQSDGPTAVSRSEPRIALPSMRIVPPGWGRFSPGDVVNVTLSMSMVPAGLPAPALIPRQLTLVVPLTCPSGAYRSAVLSSTDVGPSPARTVFPPVNISVYSAGWPLELAHDPAASCKFDGVTLPLIYVSPCEIQCVFTANTSGTSPLGVDFMGQPLASVGPITAYNVAGLQLVPSVSELEAIYTGWSYLAVNVELQMQDDTGALVDVSTDIQCTVMDPYGFPMTLPSTADPGYAMVPAASFRTSWTMLKGRALVASAVPSAALGTYTFSCTASGYAVAAAFAVHVRSRDEYCGALYVNESMTQVVGCATTGTPGDYDCGLTGAAIVLYGSNFIVAELPSVLPTVRIGPQLCRTVSVVPNGPYGLEMVTATDCGGTGLFEPVYVISAHGGGLALTQVRLRLPLNGTTAATQDIVITSASGCDVDAPPSTAACRPASVVTIAGTGFVAAGTVTGRLCVDSTAAAACIAAAFTPVTDTLGLLTNFTGTGLNLFVSLRSGSGKETRSPDVTVSFETTVMGIPCPTSSGLTCAGHGTCQSLTGQCICYASDALGYWTGSSCAVCTIGAAGPSCAVRCPYTPAGLLCGQGVCSDGLAGTGFCTCTAGYVGPACNFTCPGGAATPCLGRGSCSFNGTAAVCSCDSQWGGANCSKCAAGFVGAACDLPCPTSGGLICGGNGTCVVSAGGAACQCTSGSCGASCNSSTCAVCGFGLWGAACGGICPGTNVTHVCSGRGTCDSGVQGTGVCYCTAGWGTSNCSVACPSATSAVCSGHGTCDPVSATCTCSGGYRGAGCQIACPTTALGVCNGLGTCDATGTCICNWGYAGARCNITCNGGAVTPCSNHGQCVSTTGACTCHANATSGYWSGAICGVCASGWGGASCTIQCPAPAGVVCSGHGTCSATGNCTCAESTATGFWAQDGAGSCSVCKSGYYGSTCMNACVGGACSPCNLHGTCSDGLTGTGACTCASSASTGYWTGLDCSQCQSGYFGVNCTGVCPACPGGTCSSGVTGTGDCTCTQSATAGYWTGASCSSCLPGAYGADCKSVCPGSDPLRGVVCSGNGTCDATGNCTCVGAYGGAACNITCPKTNGYACAGHGTCSLGTCTCYANAVDGYWRLSTGCSECKSGYYGSQCTLSCPANATGSVCSGHGTCADGRTGAGTCSCVLGFWGPACENECPGGAAAPCGFHGTCNSTTGTCTCYASAGTGWWTGAACATCAPLYASTGCTIACPASGGLACSGHGTCFGGACSCGATYCGSACQNSGATCLSECPAGYYGAACVSQCPGGGNCNGNGICSSGKAGTGLCSCFEGYFGSNCAQTCPGGVGNACSGSGTCSAATGQCTCLAGYALADCSVMCPGGATNPCSGLGTCHVVNATCTCSYGYAGADCSDECPGGASLPCNGHGTCNSSAAACTCAQSAAAGYWAGAACDECLAGWSGSDCKTRCGNGTTVGTTCVCADGYSGPGCYSMCPGDPGSRCSGQGTCLWGESYAESTCVCTPPYYGPSCSVYCTAAACQGAPSYLVNGQCDPESGACVCLDDDVSGHWSDESTRCTTCTSLYYGPQCLLPCPCLGHGSCDRSTGTCSCFDTDALGHYAGSSCERCATGYIGDTCQDVDVAIARQKPCTSIATLKARSPFILIDAQYNVLYAGGRPVLVCNMSSRSVLRTEDMGATVIGGHIRDTSRIVLTLSSFVGESSQVVQRRVFIQRSANPTLRVVQQSALISTASPSGTVTLASTERALMAAPTFTAVVVVASVVDPVSGYTLNVNSNGVVLVTDGLVEVGVYAFSALFDQVMTADVVPTVNKLIMGGRQSGAAQLIAVQLPLTGTDTAHVLSTELLSASTACTGDVCTAISRVATAYPTVVAAVATTTGFGLVRFEVTADGAPQNVYSNVISSNYDDAAEVNITAMILDSVTNAGFVAACITAASDSAQPSMVYKFDIATLTPYGSVRFSRMGAEVETVASLALDATRRLLYATIPLASQVSAVPLSVYAVTKVFPGVADTRGGTIITLDGEGFMNVSTLRCNFNGTAVAATYESSQRLYCPAPAGGDERCDGVPLEVSVADNLWTANNLLLRRVPSATVARTYTQGLEADLVDNAYGPYQSNTTVVVIEGSNFVDSNVLTCRFASDDSSEVQVAQHGDTLYAYSSGVSGVYSGRVEVVNSTLMHCMPPPFAAPTKGVTRLAVALDGNILSTTTGLYEAVGPAVGIAAFKLKPTPTAADPRMWVRDEGRTLDAGTLVNIGDVHIFAVDANMQRLRRLDAPLQRNVTVSLLGFERQVLMVGNMTVDLSAMCQYSVTSVAASVLYVNGSTTVTMALGVAVFSGAYLVQPAAGTYTLRFDVPDMGWAHELPIAVSVGPAARIRICVEPSTTIDNTIPALAIQPVVYLEDASGNVVAGDALIGRAVGAAFRREWTSTGARDAGDSDVVGLIGVETVTQLTVANRVAYAQQSGVFFKFTGIEMSGLYGSTYSMTFFSPGLPNVSSISLTVKWCPDNRAAVAAGDSGALMFFARYNTSECFQCPSRGVCDGTPNVTIADSGMWRADPSSYLLYPCGAPNACIAPSGSCAEGYTGVRCSVCAEGYGHRGEVCRECPSPAVTVLMLVGLGAVALIFVCALVYASFATAEVEILPVVLKIAINHLQVASRMTDVAVLPNPLYNLFSVQSAVAELIRIDILAWECAPLYLSTYEVFYIVIALPGILALIFGAFFFVLHLTRVFCGKNEVGRPDGGMEALHAFVADGTVKVAADHSPQRFHARRVSEVSADTTDDTKLPPIAVGVADVGMIDSPASPASPDHNRAAELLVNRLQAQRARQVRRHRVMALTSRFIAKLRERARATRHEGLAADERHQQHFTAFQCWVAAALAVLLLIYPSVLQWCVGMWTCETIRAGDGSGLFDFTVLSRDRSIYCDDPTYLQFRIYALAAAVVYGFGVPALCTVCVYAHWRARGRAHARRLYGFLTFGFTTQRWYWEVAAMLRKALLVLVLIFIDSLTLRTYMSMWILTAALGAHALARPYDTRYMVLHYLDALCMAALLLTLNLSLLFDFAAFASATAGRSALTIGMFVINIVLLCVVGLFVLYHCAMRVRRWYHRRRREQAERAAAEAGAPLSPKELAALDAAAAIRPVPKAIARLLPTGTFDVDHGGRAAAEVRPGTARDGRAKAYLVHDGDEMPFDRVRRLERTREEELRQNVRVLTREALEDERDGLADRAERAEALADAETTLAAGDAHLHAARESHEARIATLTALLRSLHPDVVDAAVRFRDEDFDATLLARAAQGLAEPKDAEAEAETLARERADALGGNEGQGGELTHNKSLKRHKSFSKLLGA